MITLPATSTLSKPTGSDPVPLGTFGYFRARHRTRVYEMVLREFMESGLTQADLARRMSKRPDVICRWLGAPGNWTLDTVSDLLFAISGGEPEYQVSRPLDEPGRNMIAPSWLCAGDERPALPAAQHNFASTLPQSATKSAAGAAQPTWSPTLGVSISVMTAADPHKLVGDL